MVHPLISFICIAPSHEQIHEHTKYFKQKTTPRTLRSKTQTVIKRLISLCVDFRATEKSSKGISSYPGFIIALSLFTVCGICAYIVAEIL